MQVTDDQDPYTKVTSFSASEEVSAQHVGFVIGAFEEVDLSSLRGSEEDDRLGQSAIPVHAFCAPGRSEELRNTCFPLVQV